MKDFRFEELINKKILFKGEVSTGKTSYMLKLLNEASSSAYRGRMTMMDLAPKKVIVGKKTVGGPVRKGEWTCNVNYFRSDSLVAPRLNGKTKDEVLSLAKKNAEKIEAMFDSFLKEPTEVLFINDLTIYLHAGELAKLVEVVKAAKTFIGNAYEGTYLREDLGSGISQRERSLLMDFEKMMDVVIKL